MSAITAALSSATVLFGTFVVLAVLVTGFFVGRRWLAKVDEPLQPGRIIDAEGGQDIDGSGWATVQRDVGGTTVAVESRWDSSGTGKPSDL